MAYRGKKVIFLPLLLLCVCVHNGKGFTVGSFMWIDVHYDEKGKEWTDAVVKVCQSQIDDYVGSWGYEPNSVEKYPLMSIHVY